MSQQEIVDTTSFSIGQVRYTIAADSDIVGFNRRGVRPKMAEEE
jgi:hypothetical protein